MEPQSQHLILFAIASAAAPFTTRRIDYVDVCTNVLEYETLTESFIIPERITQGMVVEITRFEHDYIQEFWTAPLFIRQHLVDRLERMMAFFNDVVKRKLYVVGAPGCGKTCFFWLLACMIMAHQGKKVLFIQYRVASFCTIWIMENSTIQRLKSPTMPSSNVTAVVRAVFQKHGDTFFDVCICVGMRVDDDPNCASLLTEMQVQVHFAKILKLVIVTSRTFRISSHEMIGTSTSIVDSISFDSWRKEDYERAVLSDFVMKERIYNMLLQDWNLLLLLARTSGLNNTDVATNHKPPLSRDQLLEVVRKKYHLAGGCPRFMFDVNLDQLEKVLKQACHYVPDWNSFTPLSVPYSASDEANSLMQRFEGVVVQYRHISLSAPVSKYVLLRAYDNCRTSSLTAAVETVAVKTRNATLKGWAFALSQFDIIRSAYYDATKARRRIKTTLVGNAKLEFCPMAECGFNGMVVTGDEMVNHSVIWCSKWNQECCDVAFYFDQTLVTLQFTVVVADYDDDDSHDHHSLEELWHLKHLRAALFKRGLEVERMVHMVIVPDNLESLSLDRKPTSLSGQEHDETRRRRRRRGGSSAPDAVLLFSVEVMATAPMLKLLSPAAADAAAAASTMAFVKQPGDFFYDIYENKGGGGGGPETDA